MFIHLIFNFMTFNLYINNSGIMQYSNIYFELKANITLYKNQLI